MTLSMKSASKTFLNKKFPLNKEMLKSNLDDFLDNFSCGKDTSIVILPHTQWDILKTTPDSLYNWEELSKFLDLPWEVVIGNIDRPWHWNHISSHSFITFDKVYKYRYKPFDWYEISRHENISWDIIRDNPELPWEIKGICLNPNLTWENVMEGVYVFDLNLLLKNENVKICWEDVSSNLFEIDYEKLSSNPNLPISFVRSHIMKRWNWRKLSKNFTIEAIIAVISENPKPRFLFDWTILSLRPDTTPSIVYNNKSQPWDYYALSSNTSINSDIINLDNFWDKDWNWEELYRRKIIGRVSLWGRFFEWLKG